MAQVPDKVLSWLYSVLHEYQDAARTYNDAARTLSAYPSLSPRTEVYTYETGASALLLTLAGTVPVTFRGTIYRFPVKLWVPHAYPREAPMCYVTPGQDMIVRPGQHVDVQGKVYHPYLREWMGMWDRASVAEFIGILQQVFAKEPPVINRAQQQQFQRPLDSRPPQGSMTPGAPPPPPPKQISGFAELPSGTGPPPRPPKPGEDGIPLPQRATSRNVSRDGPPLPPLPTERPLSQVYHQQGQHMNGYAPPPRPGTQVQGPAQPAAGFQDGRPAASSMPHLPPQQHHDYRNHHESPVSPLTPRQRNSNAPDAQFTPPPRMPQHQQHPQQLQQYHPPQQHNYHGYQQPQHQHHPRSQQFAPQHSGPPSRKQPPPDLLSDPFDVALPASVDSTGSAPAPPIPPNPEKEHLLQALSAALVQQGQQKVDQNLAALAPLQAQQAALRAAQSRLESELQQLDHLDKTLTSNEQILHRSIQDCDKTIQLAKQKKQPPIDEVLIASTMVANQLWTLCAEESACREAMYVLQKAVDRGRIGGADFARQMRGLGRECFLKMALARKCANGMGLEMGSRYSRTSA